MVRMPNQILTRPSAVLWYFSDPPPGLKAPRPWCAASFGKPFAAVHGGFCQLSADAGLCDRPSHSGDKLSAGLCDGSTACFDLLHAEKQGGNIGIFFGHVALYSQIRSLRPGQQIHVICKSPGKLLGGVGVGLTRPGMMVFPVQSRISSQSGSLKMANAMDAVILNEDISLAVNPTAVVHGKNHGVFQKNFHKSWSSWCGVPEKLRIICILEIGFSISENFAIVTCEI